MSKRRKPAVREADKTGPTVEQIRGFIRSNGARYLELPNVNSVGLGYKNGRKGELCVQFTVDVKARPEQLESLGTKMIPPTVEIAGFRVPTDVMQRRFKHSLKPVAQAKTAKDQRKQRQPTLRPGLSISHPSGTAGTLGAIVYAQGSGTPLALSNWHVLHTERGRVGDPFVQPGPFDDNRVEDNRAGTLVRSHLGAAGDCAVASIEGRAADPTPIGLDTGPLQLGEVELGDPVIKSGRTTGITRGVVSRIDVQSKMTYGAREVVVGGFEIGPDPKHPARNGEVSMGGDSGSLWIGVGPDGKPSDLAVGLHFAGEAGDETREFALACNLRSVLEKLEVTLQPSTAALSAAAEAGRPIGGSGYDAGFTGVTLALPSPRKSVESDFVGADGDRVAHYTHFSLSMRKSKRLCGFVAWNIDGGNITKPSNKGATWQLDGRVPDAAQVDNTLYRGTVFDRGHIAKREDLLWGGAKLAKRANDDSFTYTNATPQHKEFNRLAPALWKSLEDEVFGQVDVANMKLSVLGGPIFRDADRLFKPSDAPAGFKAVRIPREYFKIVAYVDEADGRAKAQAFRLSQQDLIGGPLEEAVVEELDLSEFRMFQVRVTDLESLTKLSMPDWRAIDTFEIGQPEGLRRSLRPGRAASRPEIVGVDAVEVRRFSEVRR